ncbi:MAG TPA: Hsp20/alpha crystallin family protein [Chitinispirillaceae bacterium]|nr:Hsp20/alpha crystallin family protein [Chitinispirillaceae bacterium]
MFWNTDVLHEMNRLRREMNNLFSSYPGNSATATYPLINIYDSPDNIIVTAELPGMAKENIAITFADNSLTLSGKLDTCDECKKMAVIRQERSKGNFEKTVRLPSKIVSEKIEASFNNGILSISLPKAEEAKPKTITVNMR